MFWDLTPCCLVEICLIFGITCRFHRTVEMETPRCYETSGVLYQTTRRHIDDSTSHSVGRGVWAGLRWLRKWSGGGLTSWRQGIKGRKFLEFLSSCWLPAGQGRGSMPAALLQQDVYGTVVIICATCYNTKKSLIKHITTFQFCVVVILIKLIVATFYRKFLTIEAEVQVTVGESLHTQVADNLRPLLP